MKENIRPHPNEEIKNNIKNFINKIIERNDFEQIWKETIDFCNNIKNKRDDYLNCLAYHWLIGSTPDYTKQLFLDFKGEESILEFINRFKEKYKIS